MGFRKTIHGMCAGAAIGLLAGVTQAQVAPTAFTYQGQLEQGGVGVNDTLPMVFRLFDSPVGGSQVGSSVIVPGVNVQDGVFAQSLDFGAIQSGSRSYWLEVTVDGFVLSPRHAITGSPYALQTRGIHVDDAGRVGIGTTTPSGDLEIAKDGASVVVRSTEAFSPAVTVFQGSVPGIGGVYSKVGFENGFGFEVFGLQHDNAFGIDYFTFRTSEYPAGLIRVREDGAIGIGDLPSGSPLHVVDRDIGVFNDGMLNETLSLEDNDAVLGIYSSDTGNFGSALVFGESIGNAVTDKWGMVRTTSNTSPELRVTYGSNPNYAQNQSSVTFVPGGLKFPDGSVQTTASSIVDIGDFVPSGGSVRLSGPVLVGKREVTISEQGQAIFVVGTANGVLDGEGTIQLWIGYRPAGSGSVSLSGVVQTVSSNDQGSTLEQWNWSGPAIIQGQSPGTYEVGVYVSPLNSALTPHLLYGANVSAFVFE